MAKISNITRLPFPGLINELLEWQEDHSKKVFRSKVIRIYVKCLRRGKIELAVKIAKKYHSELTNNLRSDFDIATNFSLFLRNIQKDK